MLLSLGHNLIVNTAAVKTIEPIGKSPEGYPRYRVNFIDGTREIVIGQFDKLDQYTGLIIPAPAGYQVVRSYVQDDGERTFSLYPVVAFQLDDGELMPVAPWVRLADERGWALMWPDGRCECVGDQLFDSLADFKASFGEDADG